MFYVNCYNHRTILNSHVQAKGAHSSTFWSTTGQFSTLFYHIPYLLQEPYVNQSAVSIQSKFSLHRTYIIFRSLGLRHLTVVNECNQVVGVITRKDLMGFNMEEKISDIIKESFSRNSSSVELNENVSSLNRAI